MAYTTLIGKLTKNDNNLWLNNFLVRRTGNNDYEDKLLNRFVGYEIESKGLIYNNVFFLHSYSLKGSPK